MQPNLHHLFFYSIFYQNYVKYQYIYNSKKINN